MRTWISKFQVFWPCWSLTTLWIAGMQSYGSALSSVVVTTYMWLSSPWDTAELTEELNFSFNFHQFAFKFKSLISIKYFSITQKFIILVELYCTFIIVSFKTLVLNCSACVRHVKQLSCIHKQLIWSLSMNWLILKIFFIQ